MSPKNLARAALALLESCSPAVNRQAAEVVRRCIETEQSEAAEAVGVPVEDYRGALRVVAEKKAEG